MTTEPSFFKPALANPNRAIAFLYARVEQQKKMLLQIKTALPKTLAEHTLHCVANDKKLSLYTDSAVWATQLRFYKTVIIEAIAPITPNIEILQIKIDAALATRRHPPRQTAKVPTPAIIAAIRHDAKQNPNDPLNQALMKLSSTLAKLAKQS